MLPVTLIVLPGANEDPETVTPAEEAASDEELGTSDEDEPTTAKLLDDCAATAVERRAKIKERMLIWKVIQSVCSNE